MGLHASLNTRLLKHIELHTLRGSAHAVCFQMVVDTPSKGHIRCRSITSRACTSPYRR